MGNVFSSFQCIIHRINAYSKSRIDNKSQCHKLHEIVHKSLKDYRCKVTKNKYDYNEYLITDSLSETEEAPEFVTNSNPIIHDENPGYQSFTSDNESHNSMRNFMEQNGKESSIDSLLPEGWVPLPSVLQDSSTEDICQNGCGVDALGDFCKKDACSVVEKLDAYNIDDLCNDIIDEIIPKSETDINIIVLNAEEDKDLAEELACHLRKVFGCRAAPIEALKPLYHICGAQCLRVAQKWADILMIIISSSWIREIKNVKPMREIGIQTTRYHHKLIETYYLQSSCVNYTLLPVVKPGTRREDYSDIVEIKDCYSLDDILNNFKTIADLNRWSKRSKELVEKSLKIKRKKRKIIEEASTLRKC